MDEEVCYNGFGKLFGCKLKADHQAQAADLANQLGHIRDQAQARMKAIGIDRTRYRRHGVAETTAAMKPDVRRQRRMVVEPDIIAASERTRTRRTIQ